MSTSSSLSQQHGVARRHVGAHLEATVIDTAHRGDLADLALAIAVADHHALASEQMTITLDGEPVHARELTTRHHGRLHLLTALRPGHLVIDYSASVAAPAPPVVPDALDSYQYLRPSRYCESDRLGPHARAEFAGLAGRALLDAVSSWVGTRIAYRPGTSRPIDGAIATLLAREGVCRDFAHLCAALLRANGMPARAVSVYAPGLDPMDFHAVTEAFLDGAWCIVDPTCLAPRATMLRIATGADASDTAFATTLRGDLELTALSVVATTDDRLPLDDLDQLVQLT